MTRQICKLLFFMSALMLCAVAIHAQEIEKVDKFTSGYIWPEIFLRDSRGKYTWAWRRAEECIK